MARVDPDGGARLRVCLVTAHLGNAYHATRAHGVRGAEVQYDLVSRALADRFEVHVVTSPPESPGPIALPPGIQVHFVDPAWRTAKGRLRRFRLYARAFNAALKEADARVYMQTVLGIDTTLTQRFCRRGGRRFVYHWASDADLDRLTTPGHALTRHLYRRSRRAADLQVCQTELQQGLLSPAERARSAVVPNVLDTTVAWQAGTGKGTDVLWVGAIGPPFKRPDLFLDLVEALPHRPFRMVGPLRGAPNVVQAVRERAARLPNLNLVGFLDKRADLPAQYAQARCHVSTSDYEGFPNTFLESCASGVPVASLRVDPNGMLERDGAGVCASGDFAALVRGVESMFEPAAWAARRKAALAVAQAHHPTRIAERFAACLERAAGVPRAP
ncbi:MAG: hypothetical protein QOI63_922 [Thermoplasmata archaeon]|jgi:glycosyltransferase involved in cell wall biosynthesis|nr:hypothetical protein [Thermoplasmata archaeon]